MPRPFRFGVNLLTPSPGAEWRARCRLAEELGYDVILVPDHLGMVAPFPVLVAAAAVTERPRLGTLVLNAGLWNPALLAREVATTDALTDGRLELGLGTGYVRAEHERAGLPFGAPQERADQLRRTVEELERLLGSGEAGFRPVQDRVPLLIGGDGERTLPLGVAHADVIGFTGARMVGGQLRAIPAKEVAERVARYEELAAGRAVPAERNLLLQTVAVTDDPASALAPLLEWQPGLTLEEALELPVVLVGSLDEVVAKALALRERYGFSYLTVLEPYLEVFAPVLERLRAADA
ncbi:TIGR03621 family F420-dependent LLM class oxidoreductase [Streptomyces sp. LaPpAH-108]|uniref:TIGR03621 family F420-dependent LLM class oxidoreductase n=1 Tax=Streptomyces sp. LaPpAH-108 TaxID=1155714 RepID=UPI00035CC80C|nr:TIGR03621 family F420-dependent LLM class oxidoreductase [Streptomyces sp. LaPpAH-108]